MAQEIDLKTYIAEVRKNISLNVKEDIIRKDLLLTLILSEFEKNAIGRELIFKGGTLLSRNYLNYHRFSEDLDFVYAGSEKLRELNKSAREKDIKNFVNSFVPQLKKVADILGLDFSEDRSNTKYCYILHGRTVYTFKMYFSEREYIKIEINFIEKLINLPIEKSIKVLTDFFDSKELLFILGLEIKNFNVKSYSLNEIILEKYRAVLTRNELKERDLFDLYLIPNSLNADIKQVAEKISSSSLIKRELYKNIAEKMRLLEQNQFFNSDENISDFAITEHNLEDFERFKEKIKVILLEICKELIKKQKC